MIGASNTVVVIIGIIFLGLVGIWGWFEFRYTQKKKWFFQRNWNHNEKDDHWKKRFFFAACLFFLLGTLRPQWGISEEAIEYKGLDILWVLDVSKSMRALDFSTENQTVNRLQVSKSMINNFVQKRSQDRFGLIAFAGDSFVSVPLTFDRTLFLNFLEDTSEKDVARGGTNLQEAIGVSLERLTVNKDEERGRAIILITDGDQTVNTEIENLSASAGKNNIPIFTIGVGSLDGVRIPEGRDVFGRMVYKQYKGHDVVTKLNESVLKRIASLSGGEYFHAESLKDIEELYTKLDQLPVDVLEVLNQQKKKERYQLFFILGFFSFCLSVFIPFSAWNQFLTQWKK